MTTFQIKVINKLIDLYERSQQSWKEGVKKRATRIKVETDTLFSNYVNSRTPYIDKPDIEKDIKSLESSNYISVKRDKTTNDLLLIDLNIDNLEAIYKTINRKPLKSLLEKEKEKVLSLLDKYNSSPLTNLFLNHIIMLIENHISRKKYFDEYGELEEIAKIIYLVDKQNHEILLRVFSKKNFGDSKLIENRGSKIIQIFNEFGNIQYETLSDLLEDHNILKNKGNAIVKQGIVFSINNQIIDLSKFQEDFYLSMNMISNMNVISISKTKVITIENLTTFYTYKDDDAIIIYLGGFHNSVKRELLRKIYDFNCQLAFYHFGDIDAGGFQILMDLRAKTGIDFKPLHMAIEDIKQYKNECQSLTENDKKRLEKLLYSEAASEYYETIKFMLSENIKLEQESIEI